jgi:SAM-dependent methyltransferase
VTDGWYEANKALWDERVPIHVASEFYDNTGWLDGREALRPFEIAEVGDVAGRTLFHPQCHFGQDPLSWARLGATVTGLDFSEPAVAAARDLAARAGIDDARFVCADVYDASAAVDGATFDVVYTGLGALNWLHDIERWAATMASVCRPGGTLYLAEFHPFVGVFWAGEGEERAAAPLVHRQDYFGKIWHDDEGSGTYADLDAPTTHNETWERAWTLGEVVSAIAGAGFRLEFLHEHDHTLFPAFGFLEQHGDGTYRLPDGLPSLPMMYSVRAVRDRP